MKICLPALIFAALLAAVGGGQFLSAAEPSAAAPSRAASPAPGWRRDLDYAGRGNPRQTLDVLVPADAARRRRPLVLFVHGGSWESGRKEDVLGMCRALAATGDYVTATLNYRLSQEALWPAQLHDCKAAIRFLKGRSAEFGIDPEQIGVCGFSAGGHLACMLGAAPGNAAFEGDLGPFPKAGSQVRCVVNFFGPTDFLTIGGDPNRPNPVSRLLGATGAELLEKAKQASPVTWVGADSAPVLTAHGTRDTVVPFSQARELDAALKKAGIESHLITISGGGHGFFNAELDRRIRQFLDNHLRGATGSIPATAIPAR